MALVRKEIGAVRHTGRDPMDAYLPKTRSGKIMRRILRKIAANDLQAWATPPPWRIPPWWISWWPTAPAALMMRRRSRGQI